MARIQILLYLSRPLECLVREVLSELLQNHPGTPDPVHTVEKALFCQLEPGAAFLPLRDPPKVSSIVFWMPSGSGHLDVFG